jgi:Zn-dependent alcohol dehydrogenase
MKTRAAVCRGFGEPLAIEDIELAPPGFREVRVRIAACAICHSDISCIDGSWGGALPAVYGHEAAGVVEEIGPGVAHLRAGDHVVVTLVRSCGRCVSCAGGAPAFCETVFPLDRQSPLASLSGEAIVHGLRTGAFAEHVVVEASQAVAIDKDVPLASAALIACGVLTGIGAVINTAGVKAGSEVLVIGCGGVGLNSVQGARLAGCSTIVAIDVSDAKLEVARVFGATHAVNSRREDLAGRVAEITGGRKAEYVFVTVGAKSAIEQGVGLMRRGGATVIVGMPAGGVAANFDPGWLAADGQSIIGCRMGSARLPIDVPRIIDFYRQGRLKLDELISGRYRLEQINEAVDSARRGAALRNVIVFEAGVA